MNTSLTKNKYLLLNTFFQFILFLIYLLLFCISYFIPKTLYVFTFLEIIIIISLVILEYKRNLTYVSPLIFWYLFWLLVLSIARIDLKIYDFNSIWGINLIINISMNTFIFFLSYQLIFLFLRIIKFKLHTFKFNFKLDLYKILKLIIIISNIAFILNCIVFKTIPQLSSNIDVSRRDFITGKWFSIVNITRFFYSILPYYFLYEKNKNRKKNIIKLSATNFFFTFLSGWRTYLFQIIIFFATTQLILFFDKIKADLQNIKKIIKNQKKFIFICLFLALFFIILIAVTRGGTLEPKEYLEYSIKQIYLYVAPNFLNYQTAMNSLIPNYNFMYTTEALWGIFLPAGSMPGYKPLSFSIGAFNVSTYLLHPYADYGIIGTFFWSFLIASLAAYYFINTLNKRNIHNLVMLGIINITIFNLHNGFFLRSSSILIWFFASYFITLICYEKK